MPKKPAPRINKVKIDPKDLLLFLKNKREDGWKYAGRGGIDTDIYCKRGVSFHIPGIKQIVSYGINNDIWWTKYFVKWQVIIPDMYRTEGKNKAIDEIINYIGEQMNYEIQESAKNQ